MRLGRKLLYRVGGALAAIVVVGLLLPETARVERRTTIDAHPATVFALVNDFHQVNKWSPWTDTDDNARFEISGPGRGVGASQRWSGNIIGDGSQTIVESVPYERVVSEMQLSSLGSATATFDITRGADGSEVTWSFEIPFGLNLPRRFLGLTLDRSVGRDFEAGLSRLKSMAESLPRADFSDIRIEHIVVEALEIAYLSTTSLPQATAISEAMGDAYFRILNFIDEHGLVEAGSPISISRAFSGARLAFDAGIPVRGVTADTPRDGPTVRIGTTYAGPVIRVQHVGPYRTLGETHDKIAAYLAALGIERNGDAWESYVSDPTRTAERDLLTYVYYPILAPDEGS